MSQRDAGSFVRTSWRRRAWRVLALGVALALSVWVLKGRLASFALRRAARSAGIELAWSRFELAGLSRLRIENLAARRAPDVDVAVSSLELEFDLVRFLRRGLEGVRALRARGVELDVGPFGDGEDPARAEAAPFRWPESVPGTELDIVHAVVRLAPARRVELDSARLAVDAQGITCAARRAAWIDGESRLEHPLDLEARLSAGRFSVQRASWDPRLLLERATVDFDPRTRGRADFEARARVLETRAVLSGHVERAVVDVHASVAELDVGAVLQAFAPRTGLDLGARVDLDLDVRLPWDTPAEWSGRARISARDVRLLDREFDSVSARVDARAGRLELADGFVVHGANVAHIAAVCPRPPFDPCTWLENTSAWAEAGVGDLAALCRDDIGLASARGAAEWNAAAPLEVEAALAGGLATGSVRGRGLSAARVWTLFDPDAALDGQFSLDARVRLPLREPSRVAVAADVEASDVACAGRLAEFVRARVRFEEQALAVEDALVVQGPNTLEIRSARLPPLPLDACSLREEASAQLRLDCSDLPSLLRSDAGSLAIERLPAHHLVLAASQSHGVLDLAEGEFTTADGRLRLERGRVPLDLDWASILKDERLDVALRLRFDEIASAIRVVAPEGFDAGHTPRGQVGGRARLRGSTNGPMGRLTLHARGVEFAAATIDEMDVDLDVDEHALSVARLDARSSLGVLSGAGAFEFDTHRLVTVRLDADLVDLARLAPADLPSGAVHAHVRADGEWSAIDGSIRVDADELVWRGSRVEDVKLSASATRGVLRVDELSGRAHGFDARLSGSLEPAGPSAARRFVLDDLEIAHGPERSVLARPATIEIAGSDWAVRDVDLTGSAGTLAADLSFAHGTGCADVEFTGLVPRALLGPVADWLRGEARISAAVTATWEQDDLALDTRGRVDVDAAAAGNAPAASLAWNAHLLDRRLTLEEFELDTPDPTRRAHAVIAGSFPLDPLGTELLCDGRVDLRGSIDLDDLGWLPLPARMRGSTGRARVETALGGQWSALRGTVDLSLASLFVPASNKVREFGPSSIEAHVVLADSVRIDEARILAADDARVRGAGSLGTALDARALLHGNRAAFLDAPLDAALELDAASLVPIAEHVPTLRRTGGRASARLRAAGTLRAPRITGEARLDDGEIRLASSLPTIMAVSSRVHFDGAQLVVDALTGEMGGAPFTLHGQLSLAEARPRLDLELEGKSILLWREADVSVRADADLALRGTLDALVLSGDLALRDGRYTKKLDFLAFGKRGPATARQRGLRLFALDEPPFSTMAFDVRVTSATPFSVANNVARAKLRPALELRGTGAVPELHGDVLVEPSRVLLPSGTLKVRSGRIEFRADQPDVPVLDLQADARFQGYDIEVNVSGDYDNPRVDLSSVPPLSREDLALLLITGRPPGNGLSLATGQRAAVDVAVYIARDVAAAWLSGDEEDGELLAERLEVVVGADTTRSGADAILVRLRIGGDPARHRHTVYLTGERDVFDFYNLGLRFVFDFR